jgi:IPT/TIG domain
MSKVACRLGAAVLLCSAMAWAQAGPKLTGVDPTSGKAGDAVTIAGENLGKDAVNSVLVSDEQRDYPAEIVSQAPEKIVFKVPNVKPGGYNISIKIGNNIYIQPVRFTVE